MNSAELRKAGFHQTADAVELFEIVEQEHRNLERKYNELIMAVASKWPGESRHDTALRYISESEIAAAKNYERLGSLVEAAMASNGITDNQRETLADIFSNIESLDKISFAANPVTRSISVSIDDLDDEWFRELTAEAKDASPSERNGARGET